MEVRVPESVLQAFDPAGRLEVEVPPINARQNGPILFMYIEILGCDAVVERRRNYNDIIKMVSTRIGVRMGRDLKFNVY